MEKNSLAAILTAIGRAGRNDDGSCTRICYSPAYFEAIAIVESQMKEQGMDVRLDAAGNIHGVLPGADPTAKSIIVGSHLDTVPSGGLFDGAYGVAGALQAARRLKEEGKTLRRTLEIYGFNGEESNPLGGTFGSRAVAGLIDPKQPGLCEALKSYGHTVQEIIGCERCFSNVECYLELHIEQGDLLFNEDVEIGVVSGIVGISRYKVTATGQSNHAGTTMMKKRRDAMTAMARLIAASDERCREIDERLVLTVGTISCWPGSENVIPGRVECTFEMRHMDREKTDRLINEIRAIAAEIDTVEFEIVKQIEKGSVRCDEHLMQVIGRAAQELKISHIVMPSGAGHDANPMARRLPVGMIFVPSKDGVSHSKEEWTDENQLECGVDVLYRTIQLLDREAFPAGPCQE